MAKMGKTIQLTHRLVGLLQVLEWTWKILAEYLQINRCFNGSLAEDFVSDVHQIFKRFHDDDGGDKRIFVASVVAVEHAINISEALLEQYKILMRVPDDTVRIPFSNNNHSQPDTIDRTITNRKLEKSKSKFGEHVRGILLFKSVIFTSTTLYKGCSVFKHHSENVNSVLQSLLKIGLIIAFKDGVVSSTKKAVVYAKWLPNVNDAIECQRYEELLATFNDDQINPGSVMASTVAATLLPHKAVPRATVMTYLKGERYARLNLNLNTNIVPTEGNICE